MKRNKLHIVLLFLVLVVFGVQRAYSNESKEPKVVIIATGGTIAGAGASSATTAYTAGVLSVEQILAAVEGIDEVAEIEAVQFSNVGSQNMTTKKQLELAAFTQKTLLREDVAGVVITHGTDTMEESAYLLSLLVTSPKPVVLVGAMRPSTSLSADGPLNLYGAVVAAVSEESVGRGAMVMMNGELFLGRDVMKFNTQQVNAFKAPNSAPIGAVVGDDVKYISPAFERECFDAIPTDTENLPKVAILYGHVDSEARMVDFLVSEGYGGIVFAGVGHGNTNDATLEALARAVKSGVAVVRASRVPTGEVNSQGEVDDNAYGFASSQMLNPAKARVLLQLCLIESEGNGEQAIKTFTQKTK